MINFPFGTNGKLIILGVPKFRHFTVLHTFYLFLLVIRLSEFNYEPLHVDEQICIDNIQSKISHDNHCCFHKNAYIPGKFGVYIYFCVLQ